MYTSYLKFGRKLWQNLSTFWYFFLELPRQIHFFHFISVNINPPHSLITYLQAINISPLGNILAHIALFKEAALEREGFYSGLLLWLVFSSFYHVEKSIT